MSLSDRDRADLRSALDRYLPRPAAEPTEAEIAADILGQYFTAGQIREGLAEGGTISVLAFRDDDEDGAP